MNSETKNEIAGQKTVIGSIFARDTLDLLISHLDAFLQAWELKENSAAPEIGKFLPEQGELRRLCLIELIKVDMDKRWNSEQASPLQLSEYLDQFPELRTPSVPVDLVYEDFHVRQLAGLKIEPAEYYRQFPELETELRQLLEFAGGDSSTRLKKSNIKEQLDEIEPGMKLDDFQLLTRLGRGSFAAVFLARQESMQRLVALKISEDLGVEGQTLAQLDHDYIVRVYDQRSLEDRNLRLLYMQYLPGGTLEQVIERVAMTPVKQCDGKMLLAILDEQLLQKGESAPVDSPWRKSLKTLSWSDAVCKIGACVALAIHYAHRMKTAHRDIKPANVLLSAEGLPKLADFNISFSSKLDGVSAASFFGGSVAYMSPEQLQACNPADALQPEDVDARCDIYSWGITLFELLVGSRPFVYEKFTGDWASTLKEMQRERIEINLSKLQTQLAPVASQAVIEIILECLHPDIEKRISDGQTLALKLEVAADVNLQKLWEPPQTTWAKRFYQFPLLMISLLLILPNVIATAINIFYNRAEIVKMLQSAIEKFDLITTVNNAIAFPVGIAVLIYFANSAIKSRDQPTENKNTFSDIERQRGIHLGLYASLISLTEWILVGISFPLILMICGVSLTAGSAFHFIVSLLFCGLIAASFAYFLISSYSLRYLYLPTIKKSPELLSRDANSLNHMHKSLSLHLILSASVPVFTILAMVVLGSEARYALIILAIAALAGFGFAFWEYRKMQKIILRLQQATQKLFVDRES